MTTSSDETLSAAQQCGHALQAAIGAYEEKGITAVAFVVGDTTNQDQ